MMSAACALICLVTLNIVLRFTNKVFGTETMIYILNMLLGFQGKYPSLLIPSGRSQKLGGGNISLCNMRASE